MQLFDIVIDINGDGDFDEVTDYLDGKTGAGFGIYTDTDEDGVGDAADKIDQVLRNSKLQTKLRSHLYKQGTRFSTEAFINGLRTAVEKFLGKKPSRYTSFNDSLRRRRH